MMSAIIYSHFKFIFTKVEMGVKRPIVVPTANTLQSDKDLFFEAGVDDFQTKVSTACPNCSSSLIFLSGSVHSSEYCSLIHLFFFSEKMQDLCYQCTQFMIYVWYLMTLPLSSLCQQTNLCNY